MAHVSMERGFNTPASAVWTALADFCDIGSWLPGIERVQEENNGKRRRMFLPNGAIVVEDEVARDDKSMSLTYVLIEGLMPFTNYRSTMSIVPAAIGCTLRWESTFEPIGPEADAMRFLQRLYDSGFRGLAVRVGGN
jgi:hypothetical protein